METEVAMENEEEVQRKIEWACETLWDGGPEEFIEAGICDALIEIAGRDISYAHALLQGYYESWLRHGNVPKIPDHLEN